MPRYVAPGPLRTLHVELASPRLRLEPLGEHHLDGLLALFDAEIWRWYSVTLDSRDAQERWLRGLLAEQSRGAVMAYAARELEHGELVGSTSYLNIVVPHRRVEIGSTWWAPRWQRTFVNTTAKRLMLAHAFEAMGALAVELRTDALNARSRAAIERLGASCDGLLRAQRICDDGRVRNTVVYSLLDVEWPAVRDRLLAAERDAAAGP